MILDKSLYMKGLDCVRAMVHKARGDSRAEYSEGTLLRMRTGTEIGEFAQAMFPGGVTVSSKGLSAETAAQVTQEVLSQNPPAIFEATFMAGRLAARVDVLRRTETGWDIIEIKSSSSAKPEHRKDVAFQAHVARLAGLPISGVFVGHVRKGYVWGGEALNWNEVLEITDIGKGFSKHEAEVLPQANHLLQILDRDEYPNAPMNKKCPECDYFAFCEARLPDDDVAWLYWPTSGQVEGLRQRGFFRLGDVPEDSVTKEEQKRQVRVARGEPDWIDEAAVRELLDVPEPIHFIDFETFMPAIPQWPGAKVYQQTPFQWSNHILESGHLRHEDFLFDGEGDPSPAFSQSLLRSLQGAAAIVVYSRFEEGRISGLVNQSYQGAEQIKALLDAKQLDLLEVIRQRTYLKAYRGSFSIKTVLPALVPKLSYKDLAIQGGSDASAIYVKLPQLSEEHRAKARQDLLNYCERDTLAMVEIFHELRRRCGLDSRR